MVFDWNTKSSSRYGETVRLICIHTAEGARTNLSLEAWFTLATVEASTHAGGDNGGLLQMVPYSRAAWTILSGNPITDNLELCGFAEWTREEWLDHPDMLAHAAAWIAERCAARGIPCVKITPAQVAAGQSGVIGHVDWTVGMDDGTHWDPGPNFPWDVVMAMARGEKTPEPAAPIVLEDDMIMISSPGRGQAVCGPGYFYSLPTPPWVAVAGAVVTKTVEGNDAQFDMIRAMCTQGRGTDLDLQAAADITALKVAKTT